MTDIASQLRDPFYERDLRKLGITARVTHESAGRLLVSISDDDLDILVESYTEHAQCEETTDQAMEEAHAQGVRDGTDDGYEEALGDIRSERGDAWDVVRPMLNAAFEQGHETACAEIEELA